MRIKKTNIFSILLLGFILRILIGTFTINWDFLKTTQLTAKLFNSDLAELYSYSLSLYPVLTYWTRYAFMFLSKPILSNNFLSWTASADLTAISDPHIFRYLFVLKLPFIIIEIATAYIFSLLIPFKKRASFLFIWMFNPIALYTVSAFTNVDVFPLFFIAMSLMLYVNNKTYFSSFFLGVGAAYKFFPALIMPYILFSAKNWKERFYLAIIFLIPFIGSQLSAFGIADYWKNSLFAGANRSIFTATLDIGHNKLLIYFVLIYVLLFFFFISSRQKKGVTPVYYFLALVPVFIISAFNIQWVYWILPLILFYQLYFQQEKIVLLFLHISFLGIIILSQWALHIGMLAPVAPSLWTFDRPLNKFMANNDAIFLVNIFYTVFAACVIFISYRVYKLKKFFMQTDE